MSGSIGVELEGDKWLQLMTLCDDKPSHCGSPNQLSLSSLINLASFHDLTASDIRLHRVMEGASIILPTREKQHRSDELDERVQRLKIKQQHHEYNNMVADLTPPSSNRKRAPLISGLNFAVTVFASVIATCFVLRSIIPDLMIRCALGFTVGMLLMCVEVFLAVRELSKQESGAKKNL